MYLDLEDYRPDTPRVPSVISIREGVLLSLVLHGVMLFVILFVPMDWLQTSAEEVVPVPVNREPMKYVQMMPAIDREELARMQAELSDIDRRSATRERAPVPQNQAPFSLGNTPEKVIGGPNEPPELAAAPSPPSPPVEPMPDNTAGLYAEERPAAPPSPPAPRIGRALRNLQQYLQDNNYDNALGGAADQNADIQFDSKGADFGPWLRRFVAQVRRNWLIPQVAELVRGHVVVQFTVLRNGAIVDLRVTKPAAIDALTVSALNAIKLSNPTASLPPDFPDDHAPFIVTFRYNEAVP